MDIKFMRGQGMSISQVARQTGHTRKTVRRQRKSGDLPCYKARGPRPTVPDPYKDVLEKPFSSGIQNGVVLYERISALGYYGSYGSVKKFLGEEGPESVDVSFYSGP